MPKENETEDTMGLVVIIFIIGGISIVGRAGPLGYTYESFGRYRAIW